MNFKQQNKVNILFTIIKENIFYSVAVLEFLFYYFFN